MNNNLKNSLKYKSPRNTQIDLFNQEIPLKISTLQYRGNKYQVLDFLKPHFIGAKSILDLMAGSQSIGAYFKKYAKIISNDIQYYSYVLGKAYVENNQYQSLEIIPKNQIQTDANFNLFFNFYADNYFTIEQAKEIDAIRAKIEKIKDTDEILSFCYLSCLLKTLDIISRTAGHFYGYLEKDSQKAKLREKKSVYKEFSKICREFRANISRFQHKTYNMSAKDILLKVKNVDIIYLDPPYNRRQYSNYYHILDMCARYKGKLLKGSKTLLPTERFKSDFCDRNKVKDAFKEILNIAKDKVNQKIIISYSNLGLLKKEELEEIFREYSKKILYYEKSIKYTRQKTSNSKNIEKELLFIIN